MGSTRAEDISRAETAGSWRLWFAVLGGPIAWLTQLVLAYSLEEWFGCAPSTTEVGEVLGIGVRPAALLITAAMAAVALTAGILAWSCLRAAPGGGDDGSRRVRWMAVAGLMNSVLYGLFIVVAIVPPLVLDVCETSP